MPRPLIRDNHIQKEARDAGIQAMIEVDVKEWDEFLLTSFYKVFVMYKWSRAVIKTRGHILILRKHIWFTWYGKMS